MSRRVLIVEDDASLMDVLRADLPKRGFEVECRATGREAWAALEQEEFEVVLTDLNMAGMSGLELCERVVLNRPDTPVVLMTGFGSMDTAIASIRAGAYDFVTKPFELDALDVALRRAAEHRRLREEVKRLRLEASHAPLPPHVVGHSEPMRQLYETVGRLEASDAAVLVSGESGTGKEVLAHALHQEGRRRDGPFVAINCAAMPEALLESELFGHARGAFTDAKGARVGLFVQASGGTLFLDEIGELPLGLQPKLLRALQEKRVRPLGASAEVPFDARIIAATNCDLETAVEERRFREDLFFRINVIHLVVPPLRERGNDVLVLAQHFLRELAERAHKQVRGLSAGVAQKFLAYAWPGNVRELQNCIERAVALTLFQELTVEDLPERIRSYRPTEMLLTDGPGAPLVSLAEVERRYILHVLQEMKGHRGLAARALGLDRKTLYRKLARYEHPDAPPPEEAGHAVCT